MVVNAYSEGWLRKGFPWVYPDEVVAWPADRSPGRVVDVRAGDGGFLGRGVLDEGRVAVRVFRRDEGELDEAFFADRLRAALDRRRLPPDTTAWRLAHGENDDLPGFRVDAWDEVLSVSVDAPGLRRHAPTLAAALRALGPWRQAWLVGRTPPEGGPRPEPEPLFGPAERRPVVVRERGMAMEVRPWEGADAGLYADMRDVRAWLAPHWGGRSVLNLFAFTGAFSVAAALGGAREVTTCDLAAPVLARARANFALNGLDPEAHAFERGDTFAVLDALRRKGRRFDVVVADPPSFSRDRRGGAWSVERDLGRLVAACLRVLEPGGWLVVASNHGGLSPRDFGRQVRRGAARAGRALRLLHEGSTPVDFPAALDFPEGRYLKCWVLGA